MGSRVYVVYTSIAQLSQDDDGGEGERLLSDNSDEILTLSSI